jgi:hypothetical protein
MRFAIDSVKAVSRLGMVVSGWVERGEIALSVAGALVKGAVLPIARADLETPFGPGAISWGFTAIFQTATPVVIGQGADLVFVEGGRVIHTVVPDEMPLKRSSGINHSSAAFMEAVRHAGQGSVIEIGSRARSGISRRDRFAGLDYLGVDIAEGPNVDLVADAHDLPDALTDNFDFAYSMSTFEHLLMPWKAALELNKVLKVGGLAYIQSHPTWPIHEEPWDFFRFSKYAWKGLFNAHTGFEFISSDHLGKAFITPEFVVEEPMRGLAGQATYLVSCCLARKIGPPLVRWDAKASEVANLAYDHR